MFFRDVVGQDEAKKKLIHEVHEGRIAHAQIFYGPQGVGKMPLAIAYTRFIHCTNRQENDACGTCPSCIKFNKLVHPDAHFAFPTVKKKTSDTYLPEWRNLVLTSPYFSFDHWLAAMKSENAQAIIYAEESDDILRKLSLKSAESEYKTMIVWLPEKMNVVCANKLLKLFEEPPKNTVLILVSNAPDMVLGTLMSRAQHFPVRRIEEADMARALEEKYGVQPAHSKNIAHIANGSYTKALEEIHLNEEHQKFFDLFVNLMRLSYQRKIKEMKAWSETVAEMGREKQKSFLEYCQRLVRENFIYNLGDARMNYMTMDEQAFATRFAPFINVRNVMTIMNELAEAEKHIQQNVNARMVFFDFSLKMIVALKQ